MVSLSGLTLYSSVAQLATWNPKQPDMSTFQHGGYPQLMVASITNKCNFGSGVSMINDGGSWRFHFWCSETELCVSGSSGFLPLMSYTGCFSKSDQTNTMEPLKKIDELWIILVVLVVPNFHKRSMGSVGQSSFSPVKIGQLCGIQAAFMGSPLVP